MLHGTPPFIDYLAIVSLDVYLIPPCSSAIDTYHERLEKGPAERFYSTHHDFLSLDLFVQH